MLFYIICVNSHSAYVIILIFLDSKNTGNYVKVQKLNFDFIAHFLFYWSFLSFCVPAAGFHHRLVVFFNAVCWIKPQNKP